MKNCVLFLNKKVAIAEVITKFVQLDDFNYRLTTAKGKTFGIKRGSILKTCGEFFIIFLILITEASLMRSNILQSTSNLGNQNIFSIFKCLFEIRCCWLENLLRQGKKRKQNEKIKSSLHFFHIKTKFCFCGCLRKTKEENIFMFVLLCT